MDIPVLYDALKFDRRSANSGWIFAISIIIIIISRSVYSARERAPLPPSPSLVPLARRRNPGLSKGSGWESGRGRRRRITGKSGGGAFRYTRTHGNKEKNRITPLN